MDTAKIRQPGNLNNEITRTEHIVNHFDEALKELGIAIDSLEEYMSGVLLPERTRPETPDYVIEDMAVKGPNENGMAPVEEPMCGVAITVSTLNNELKYRESEVSRAAAKIYSLRDRLDI